MTMGRHNTQKTRVQKACMIEYFCSKNCVGTSWAPHLYGGGWGARFLPPITQGQGGRVFPIQTHFVRGQVGGLSAPKCPTLKHTVLSPDESEQVCPYKESYLISFFSMVRRERESTSTTRRRLHDTSFEKESIKKTPIKMKLFSKDNTRI